MFTHKFSLFNYSKYLKKITLFQPPVLNTSFSRLFSKYTIKHDPTKYRNMGIAAHIDAGKTTLSERLLYYSGRIKNIHEVKGNDGVGATMDFMDIERERGITIQSACSYFNWNDHLINLIDTPGHIDFTIEVERAMKVIDGCVMVLCAVGGIQCQTYKVHSQMINNNLPYIVYINKLDRLGANPQQVIKDAEKKLSITPLPLTINIGDGPNFNGLINLITMKAYNFTGKYGSDIQEYEIPTHLLENALNGRKKILEVLAEYDDDILTHYLNETEPSIDELKKSIRQIVLTKDSKVVPFLMGSALKNIGIHFIMDSIIDYLPSPNQKPTYVFNKHKKEIMLKCDPDQELVAYAFKLEHTPYGLYSFIRVFQGTLKLGQRIYVQNQKQYKVSKMFKKHAKENIPVDTVYAGDIAAIMGIDLHSGAVLTAGSFFYFSNPLTIPEPVISLHLNILTQTNKVGLAFSRFQKEDPTFIISYDHETDQQIVNGMGELQLQIYLERLKREYDIDCETTAPKVRYRETIIGKGNFNYLHKKQTGGAGQYGRLIGYVEPLEDPNLPIIFSNEIVGDPIPKQFYPCIENGFYEAAENGVIAGYPLTGLRIVVNDGESHPVDSNERAFKTCAKHCLINAVKAVQSIILQPIMKVEIIAPLKNIKDVTNSIRFRQGLLLDTTLHEDIAIIICEVPLNNMIGYIVPLRQCTAGLGEFTMEYIRRDPVSMEVQNTLIQEFQDNLTKSYKNKKK